MFATHMGAFISVFGWDFYVTRCTIPIFSANRLFRFAVAFFMAFQTLLRSARAIAFTAGDDLYFYTVILATTGAVIFTTVPLLVIIAFQTVITEIRSA